MKRLLHLLWIVPALVPLAAGILALTASRTFDPHDESHADLRRTLAVHGDDLEDGRRTPTAFTCEGEGVSPRSPEQ